MDTVFSFQQLQQWMQSNIIPQPAQTGNVSKVYSVADIVNASSRLSAARHLDIYRGSYVARLRECMRNQFGALAYALGPGLFDAFADDYLCRYPSHSYTLNDLGAKFARFLQETRPDADQAQKESWPDFMIELARFEYALSVIFDDATPDEVTAADAGTPDDQLQLRPVFHLFRHQYPVCKYYLDHCAKTNPELPFPQESYSVVLRMNYRLGLFEIKPAQYYFLMAMQNGASVQEAKSWLVTWFHFDPAAVDAIWPEWRSNFIASGFFVKDQHE